MLRGWIVSATLVLAACSSEGLRTDNPLALAAERIVARVSPAAPTAASVDARDVLDAEIVAGAKTPLLLLVVERTDRALTLIPAASRRGTVQWRDGQGGGLIRRGGVLVGTRGLGFDLMTADVAGLRRALRSGGGRGVVRVNRHLSGENEIVALRYACDVVPTGRQTLDFYGSIHRATVFEERCAGDGPPFVNTYWVEADGTVRRARESVSAEIGMVVLNLLKG